MAADTELPHSHEFGGRLYADNGSRVSCGGQVAGCFSWSGTDDFGIDAGAFTGQYCDVEFAFGAHFEADSLA